MVVIDSVDLGDVGYRSVFHLAYNCCLWAFLFERKNKEEWL
jgi:hypothetical protein